MEGVLENSLELTNYLATNYLEKGWDKVRNHHNRKKTDNEHRSRSRSRREGSPESPDSRAPHRSASQGRRSQVRSSSEFDGGAAPTRLPIAAGGPLGSTLHQNKQRGPSILPASRRKQLNTLPPPQGDLVNYPRESARDVGLEREFNESILQEYEAETDDPKRDPASVLPDKYLWTLQKSVAASRRDSAMASGYDDGYHQNSQYQGENRARSAQLPKSRYYDDDDSDYDEHTGRKYQGGGRGYRDRDRDDYRDYDRVVEETERYRGPPVDRSWAAERSEIYRSEAPYGAGGTVARRSDPHLDRQSHVSRRSKSRGRDDDRSYSRSPSRSRSRSNEGGIRGKLEDTFDTSARGLGVGLAGAVIGGLAGRQFGQKHRERDILIGALVGGLASNAAENKFREYKEKKEMTEEMRYEGRSRSNGR